MDKYFVSSHVLRRKGRGTKTLVNSRFFNVGLFSVVIMNSIYMGIEADFGCKRETTCTEGERLSWFLGEMFFSLAFLLEAALRMREMGISGEQGYFSDDYNKLDFLLVVFSLVDFVVNMLPGQEGVNFHTLKLLRVLRVLRLMKLIRVLTFYFKELMFIVGGLKESTKGIIWAMMLLTVLLYTFGIILTVLLRVEEPDSSKGDDADAENLRADMASISASELLRRVYENLPIACEGWNHEDYFSSVPASMFTTLQVITRDSWNTAIVRPLVRTEPAYALLFMLIIMVGTFGILNTILGLMCEVTYMISRQNDDKVAEILQREERKVLDSLRAIFEAADTDASGELDAVEFKQAMKKRHVKESLALIDIPVSDLKDLFDLLDPTKTGAITIDEFCKGSQKLKGVAKSKDLIRVSVKVGKQIGKLSGMTELQEEKNEQLDNVVDRLASIDNDFLADLYKKRKKQGKTQGPPSNAPIEDKIDAADSMVEDITQSQELSFLYSSTSSTYGGSRVGTPMADSSCRALAAIWPYRLPGPRGSHSHSGSLAPSYSRPNTQGTYDVLDSWTNTRGTNVGPPPMPGELRFDPLPPPPEGYERLPKNALPGPHSDDSHHSQGHVVHAWGAKPKSAAAGSRPRTREPKVGFAGPSARGAGKYPGSLVQSIGEKGTQDSDVGYTGLSDYDNQLLGVQMQAPGNALLSPWVPEYARPSTAQLPPEEEPEVGGWRLAKALGRIGREDVTREAWREDARQRAEEIRRQKEELEKPSWTNYSESTLL